jgi:hypothetical protein
MNATRLAVPAARRVKPTGAAHFDVVDAAELDQSNAVEQNRVAFTEKY